MSLELQNLMSNNKMILDASSLKLRKYKNYLNFGKSCDYAISLSFFTMIT